MVKRAFGKHLVCVEHSPELRLQSLTAQTDMTFKELLAEYLSGVDDCKIKSLEDLVNFNEEHAEEELPKSESVRNTITTNREKAKPYQVRRTRLACSEH